MTCRHSCFRTPPRSLGCRALPPGLRRLLTRAAPCAVAGAIVLTAAACSTPVARAIRDTKGPRVALAIRGVQDIQSVRGVRPVPGAPAGTAVQAVLSAWKAEIQAFYVASVLGDPSYRLLGLGVIPGSPEDDQMISYLSAQAASGVVGPSTWHIGNMRVVSLGRSNAVVTACSYDPGSHFRSGDLAAPAALGGGAGLTAYITDMAEMKGSWKLERSATSAEQSPSSPGPCHRFLSRLLVSHAITAPARNSAPVRAAAPAGNGGGAGSTGSSIWSWVWWLGSPLGPGPYTGGAAGGLELCVWHDIGTSLNSLKGLWPAQDFRPASGRHRAVAAIPGSGRSISGAPRSRNGPNRRIISTLWPARDPSRCPQPGTTSSPTCRPPVRRPAR